MLHFENSNIMDNMWLRAGDICSQLVKAVFNILHDLSALMTL